MKRIIFFVFSLLFSLQIFAQEILYSPTHRDDDVDIYFDILGKVGNNFIFLQGFGYKTFFAGSG